MHKIFLSFSLLLGLLFGCSKNQDAPAEVIVSIPPYLYFVEALTDGHVKALSLVPEEANPHLYEATPRQVQQAKQAKVWIRLSESFERKIETSLQEQNKNLIVVNLADSKEIPYLYEGTFCSGCGHNHYDKESKDLHIWLSLRLAKIQAELIAKALEKAFPQHKDRIEKNLSSLQSTFEKKDLEFSAKLAPYKNDSILVSHPAFGYLCRDYDLQQISIETEGKDPLPKQLSSILEQAKANSIRTVFTQAQYNNKGAEIIAQKLKLPSHQVDPYSSNYLKNFETIVDFIVEP